MNETTKLVLKNIKIIGFTFNGSLVLHAEDDICDFFKETNLIKHNLTTGEKYFIVSIKNKLEDLINDPCSIYKGIFNGDDITVEMFNDPCSIYKGIFNGDDITVEMFTTKVPQRGFVYKLYYLHSEIPERIKED